MKALLSGKNILLGVTGGIAAYKTTYLVRLFIKSGANVKVMMTKEAKEFVTPLSLSTLSKNPVFTEFVESEDELWHNHVELGKWADLICIAPATANTMAKMISGHSDNFLMATYLSADCPVYIAPAMDLDMYQHPTTRENIKKLKSFGHEIIPAESGELASGLEGEGRMAEPENILSFIENNLKKNLKLIDKKVLITAGPTYEAIDPVRFIGNHSSGKMGYAIAEKAAQNGAEVILVSGPTALKIDYKEINVEQVTSAEEMYQAVMKHFADCDIFIAAAAVSDYTPADIAEEKIKKKDDSNMQINLKKTKDILFEAGKQKTNQFLVGFALETENELENAKGKLARKNLDFIVLNSLRDKGAGFATDTNKIKIISKDGHQTYDLKSKPEVAQDIITAIDEAMNPEK
ncbi:MAG TPA: bifunctional phosphopantothenoylcysteine decarboxylase/phosphopantothenate--cysteine ligase CoaBC [Flavobacteriaceae bacterium]|nr:bifunctional phosphopantothenoylcysteine decarboxylase/phosphopantothenate--cysteine ligase CoaBC [Flavobacteriaceae bacterium]